MNITIEQFKLYNNLLLTEQMINDGLIKTHDIETSLSIISNFLSKNDILFEPIELDNNNNKIVIKYNKITFETFLSLITTINNLGYFISEITLSINTNNRLYPKKFKWNDFKKLYLDIKINNYVDFILICEAKYDTTIKLYTNLIYHVTEKQLVDKIMKNSLIPKSKSYLKTHPERIYFTDNLNLAKKYLLSKSNAYKYKDGKKEIIEFVILEIDISNIDIKAYKDPNMKDALYTYENISQKYIKIL